MDNFDLKKYITEGKLREENLNENEGITLTPQQTKSWGKILEILDNIRYWDSCPDDYKVIIEDFLETFE